MKDRWSDYYASTATKPPARLLVRALRYVKNKNQALDLGAGALVDSAFLLTQGFIVTAVDTSPASEKLAKDIHDSGFTFLNVSYDQFSFEYGKYDLISAQWALPFNDPKTFNDVFTKIKNALVAGGIFTGQFFGVRDEWNTPGKNMSFHTKEQIENLLSSLHVIEFQEEEKDGTTAGGNVKHWHIFHVIAEKK